MDFMNIKKALQILSTLTKQTVVPITNTVLIEPQDWGSYLTGTNLDVTVKVKTRHTFAKDRSFCVEAKILRNIFQNEEANDVTFALKDNVFIVKNPNNSRTFEIPIFDGEEFPQIDFNPPSFSFTIDNLDWLVNISFACHKEAYREELHGIRLDSEYAVATDGYRLCRVRLKEKIPQPITIPKETLDVLNKLNSVTKDKIHFECSSQHIYAKGPSWEVISRTIDKYPDWKAVIPNLSSDDVSSFSVGCNALREALESALIVAEKDLPTCTFHIADDELTVLNESQKGRMIQKLKLTSRGLKKKTLVFNMNYLLQALDTLSEPITFYYKGEKDPVAIVDSLYSEDCIPNYFHLIMPINPS